ncbi:MAG: mycofactocin-coupled SDR family oxidoreductase [Acidimicrobiia bacterium]
MAGRVAGKVAFITGAARGQGRSHAVRLAEEGADIIAIDICEQIETNTYPMATPEDLAETTRLVEALDRRIVARKADVRDRKQLETVINEGVAQLGRLDIVVANAGIDPVGNMDMQAFIDTLDVDFVGVHNAVAAARPHLQAGASIIITGSTAALMPGLLENPAHGPGNFGYGMSKQFLVTYTQGLALLMAAHNIRVNAVHPTNCNTHLLHQPALYKMFRPDLENPTYEDVKDAFTAFQALKVPYVEPVDISNAVLYFASDESRYVTGLQHRVDAGSMLQPPKF